MSSDKDTHDTMGNWANRMLVIAKCDEIYEEAKVLLSMVHDDPKMAEAMGYIQEMVTDLRANEDLARLKLEDIFYATYAEGKE